MIKEVQANYISLKTEKNTKTFALKNEGFMLIYSNILF